MPIVVQGKAGVALTNLYHRTAGKLSKISIGRVSYTAPYAIYVHENLNAAHPNGQAKFLEVAANVHHQDIADIIAKNIKNKESMFTAVLRAMQYLLAESNKLVPVKTGYLKSTGSASAI